MRESAGSCGTGFVCSIHGYRDNRVVRWGIEAVKNLTHRGAVSADGKTGDGAGILTQIPQKFFLGEIYRLGFSISDIDNLAVGFIFLAAEVEQEIDEVFSRSGFRVVGWRTVPVREEALGKAAAASKPRLRQIFLDCEGIEYGRRESSLYISRRQICRKLQGKAYFASLSSRTIVYKGMLAAPQLDRFYPDLTDEAFESAFCIFHQRFSTNTFPDWASAQPFRTLAHNGEINTIQANRRWMSLIGHELTHDFFRNKEEFLPPLVSPGESDSASLDRVVELLIASGFSPEHAVNMCIPPAWEGSDIKEDVKAFFEYKSLLMKPWDGPAAVVFSDGEIVGAHLDRNGLRPLRYVITEGGHMILGSEAGMVDIGEGGVRERGRLGPGETIAVEMLHGHIKHTGEVLEELSAGGHYRLWRDQNLITTGAGHKWLPDLSPALTRTQAAFGYTSEEMETSLKEMAERGREFTFSMGDDTPVPPLSERPQLLYRYFKQRFSQVTNPPIDPIRERMVMSLRMNLGHKRNFLVETAEHAKRLRIDSPVLTGNLLSAIEGQASLKTCRISSTYDRKAYSRRAEDSGSSPLLSAVTELRKRAVEAVRGGAEIVILSDRDIGEASVAIPALLAVAASFGALAKERLANRASIIAETGEARDIHQFACLIGYGASAVYPWLAFQTILDMCNKGDLPLAFEKASENYKKAVEDGLLKVMARMGISTLNSYHGAQLFDSVFLNGDFIEEFFAGTAVTVESDGIAEIEASLILRHEAAFGTELPVIAFGGDLKHRKGNEWHHWSIPSVSALSRFIRSGKESLYREFSEAANGRPVFLRHLLKYKKGPPLPLEEVEAEELILKRFFSGAMSVGALSPEAHETIAEACNALCIRSNSGEGGEDPARYWTIKNSAIKQVASGRFGVTPTYLASASELEIKIAQGAKPGEGGHLPSSKVTGYIAGLRHCPPNTLLISPPPHHDIYSIEDLAQLINDLKEANPRAWVCVKLVAETGVGAVAAGVAKSYADIIQISGCEGGTGASPVGSIKNAGNYWEQGLSEAHRVLAENGLRDKVRLRVDGGLRTGRDIIIAAMLGAEEFGFGTATMIAIGCVMARQCHLNTCPTGIATQDERLRARFKGSVEGVSAYFKAVASEVRELLAEMGVRGLDEIIGRTDLLCPLAHEAFPATLRVRAEKIFAGYTGHPVRCGCERNDNPAESMNERMVEDLLPYIEKAEPVTREYAIRNVHRSVPIRLNYHISTRYRDKGLPPDTLNLVFRGTAGQSFGGFNHRGVSITLIGEANDYTGKGMFGGRIAISPKDLINGHEQVIIGNTVLYGAVGGEFYAAGRAGERFCVRNSGAAAVVEGAGHHLCEYMTGGTVVVLGPVGSNVGAGMTGGMILILDQDGSLAAKLNSSYVHAKDPDEKDLALLKALIEHHWRFTGSLWAERILGQFAGLTGKFRKVVAR